MLSLLHGRCARNDYRPCNCFVAGSPLLGTTPPAAVVRVATVEICELTAPAPLMGAGLGHWVRDVVHSHDLRVLAI
ncbi:hypothetical protein J6590_104678 [Homalodisca vitripennis]|nr:hypothetical protein J6590_104678 [Homalodisca vitripennis]